MSTFNRWYGRHSDEFNQKRRDRYHTDAKYRARVLKQAARTRKKPKVDRDPRWKDVVIEGQTIPVLSVGELAIQIERSPQLIRVWEKKEVIPKPLLPGGARLYTRKQVKLIVALVALIEKHKLLSAPQIQKHSAKCFAEWSLA